MSKEQKNQTAGGFNPYEKAFDDAKRKLGDMNPDYFNYLKGIPKTREKEKEIAIIPFPYGGSKTSSYNYN